MGIPFHIAFEVAALLVAVFCYKTIKNTPLKWFIPFLFGIVCLEIGTYYMVYVLKMQSIRVYNFTLPIEYGFYVFLFYSYLQGPLIKKAALFLLIFLLAFSYFNVAFVTAFESFRIIQMLGSGIVLLLACSFFVDLFRSEEEISLLKEPMFWIATGVLFFNLGELTNILFWQYTYKNPNRAQLAFLHMVVQIFIYILYIFISIGLLCTRKPYRRMSSKSYLSPY